MLSGKKPVQAVPASKKGGAVKSGDNKKGDAVGQLKTSKPAEPEDVEVFPAVIGIVQHTSNVSLSLFRFVAVGRKLVVVCTLGTCTLIINILLGGFIVAQNDIEPFMIWGYYVSPVMYGQNALVINEFLDKRWNVPNPDPRIHAPTFFWNITGGSDLTLYEDDAVKNLVTKLHC